MKIRHEKALEELQTIIDDLGRVRENIIDPVEVQTTQDGLGQRITVVHLYDEQNIPPGVRVEEIKGVDIDELRAELLLAAHKLEVLASL